MLEQGGCGGSSSGVTRVGDVPLWTTQPDPEPLSSQRGGNSSPTAANPSRSQRIL